MYISQLLTRAVQTKGEAIATICGDRVHTYSQFLNRVQKFAGALRGLGISEGERVAILAHNNDRYLEFYYATPWAGGVFVPVNTRLAVPEFAYWLNDSGSEILLVDDAFAGLKDLLSVFADAGTPYLSGPRIQFLSKYSDYDDLSRKAEWADPGHEGMEDAR